MDENIDVQKKSQRLNLIIVIAILVGGTLFTLIKGGSTVEMTFGDDALTVTGPDEYSYTIVYTDIETLSLIDLPVGECVSGATTDSIDYGVWKNDELGEYNACVKEKVDKCILIVDKDGNNYVFNYESTDTTSSLYDAMLDFVAEKK